MRKEKIYFWEMVFIITGIITTICYQLIFNQGGGDAKTMFPATAKYIGYFLAILLPRKYSLQNNSSNQLNNNKNNNNKNNNNNINNNKEKDKEKDNLNINLNINNNLNNDLNNNNKKVPHFKVFLSAVFEFLSHVLGFLGLSYVGSGMYQVIYSTVVIFTAIMGHLLLQRYLRFNQWIGVIIVSTGLLFTSIPSSYFDFTSLSLFNQSNDLFHSSVDPYRGIVYYDLYYSYPSHFWDSLLGTLLVLSSTILISFNYIINDSIMRNGQSPIVIQTFSGIYTVGFCIIYSIFYTIPNIQEIFFDTVEENQGNLNVILVLYTFVTLNSFFHNFAFYAIIGEVGAVTFGLLQAVRAVGVFIGSAALFCSTQDFQCLTLPKIISTLLVMLGIFAFSYQNSNDNLINNLYFWITGKNKNKMMIEGFNKSNV